MNEQQEIIKEDFAEKNNDLSILTPDIGQNFSAGAKVKSARGPGMIKTKSKSKMAMRPGTTYAQCFSGGNFTSQYEDECPVNYSLKYSETESCKTLNKRDTTKKKFKDYPDYAETDLDQPTDFSLKYAEKTYDDESKNIAFNYYNNHKVKFKEYADYVETDLDQPTDFTLKYRESIDEDIKNIDFHFYENEERKPPNACTTRTVSEEPSCDRGLPGRYASQDETPLMFSRSSSLNSLSSFAHLTQSIPDDRSSVVSDFSRMTSGIISPSDLPDSPTQTAPSSPKRVKPSSGFAAKPDFLAKQSVFEDDVATYKQEDTPVEFSRATSLSSLNIENPLKPELVIKHNPATSIDVSKEESQNPVELVHSEHFNQEIVPEKMDHEKGKFELASVLEVDESLFADCISIDIQINCRKPKPNHSRLIMPNESNVHIRQSNGFTVKPNLRLRFHNENRKGYSTYEVSDDAVHTYYTEGTPANVSHAGSHSDLSALSIASGIPLSGADDASDNEAFFPEDPTCVAKGETLKSKIKVYNTSESIGRNINQSPRLNYLRKESQLTAKDETATFALENSPGNFSARSSLSDLTVNVMDPPLSIARADNPEETPSQMVSPLRNVSPQSPNSIVFEEVDDAEKGSEELESAFVPAEALEQRANNWDESNPTPAEAKIKENSQNLNAGCSNIDFDSNLPLTPFEEALLEECIRLGMPQKRKQSQLQETHFEFSDEGKPSEGSDFATSASTEKKPSGVREPGCGAAQSFCSETGTASSLHGDHFDFDTSEPLTPFEEVLLEQCIRLGMPQKKNYTKPERAHLKKYLEEGAGNVGCEASGAMTPLETALVEQCIRLGMSQKRTQKKERSVGACDDSHKAMSCLAVHLNRLKLNSEGDKDKETVMKKCENCPCGKRHTYRRKNTGCRRTKTKQDHFKVESCPV